MMTIISSMTMVTLSVKQINTQRAARHLRYSRTSSRDASRLADHWARISRAAPLTSCPWTAARAPRASTWMKMGSASPWPNVRATIMKCILSRESPSVWKTSTGESGVFFRRLFLTLNYRDYRTALVLISFALLITPVSLTSVCTNGMLHCRSWKARVLGKIFISLLLFFLCVCVPRKTWENVLTSHFLPQLHALTRRFTSTARLPARESLDFSVLKLVWIWTLMIV